MKASQVNTKEYNAYYSPYISTLGDTELISGLKENLKITSSFLENLSEEQLEYVYAEGKWSVKEVIQHIIDTERIFSYRALCFARGDKSGLPGFDQDEYVKTSCVASKTKNNLVQEYISLRNATINMFSGLSNDALQMIGTASDSPMSARAAGFMLIGHELHHCDVIKNKYL